MKDSNEHNIKKSIPIFLYSLYISFFTFGGGFVIISFMRKIYINKLKWLTDEQMLEIMTYAQTIPGAVAVNTAIMSGHKINGLSGAVASTIGMIIPPLLVISLLSLIYNQVIDIPLIAAIMKGMQAGITAIIADVVIKLVAVVKKDKNKLAYFIVPAAFCFSFFLKVNAVFIILPCIALGIIVGFIEEKKRKKEETV
jgi:chromate transporter